MAEEKIISIKVDVESNEKEIGALEQQLKEIGQERSTLIKQSQLLAKAGQQESKAYKDVGQKIGKLTIKQRETSKQKSELIKKTTDYNKTLKAEEKSYDSLVARNALLAKKLRGLKDPLGKSRAEFDKLAKEIKENTDELTEMDEAQGRFQRNVGNYPEMLGNISPALGGLISQFQAMTKAALAFIATPLGATLAAVAALAAPLVSFFTKTQRGIDLVEQATATLSASWDVLVDRLSSVGEAMTFIFSGELTKGLDLLKNSFKGVTTEIKAEAEAALELERRQQALIERKREFRIEEELTMLQIKEAEAIVNNTDIAASKRLAAIENARVLNNKLAEERIEIAKEELDVISQQVALGESLNEDLDAEVDARIALIQVEENQANIEKRLISQRKTLQAQVAKEQKDVIERDTRELLKAERTKEDIVVEANMPDAPKARSYQDYYDNIKKKYDEDVAAQKQAEEEKRQQQERTFNTSITLAQTTASVLSSVSRASADKQIRELQRQRDENRITEEQYQNKANEIRKQDFENQKKLQIAQVTINTAQAIARAFADYQYPVSLAISALAGAAAATQIAAIASQEYQPVQFADGGVLQGASHANGGIPFTVNGQAGFEAEGGEAIINKKSTQMFRPLLSAINEAGGGVSFDAPLRSKFAVGGLTPNVPTGSGLDLATAFQAVNNRIDNIKVVNVATETANVANRVNNIQVDASFG